MRQAWEAIRMLFRNVSKAETTKIDALLATQFAQTRERDAETSSQWARLQRRLSAPAQETRQTQARLIPRLAFASAIVAAAIVGAYFSFTPRASAPETFATRKGEQTKLVLQDSSEVTLNYATELLISKMENGKPRLLSLKGEAFFRVRRNQTPFIVSTEYADVQVVGTEFNVRARGEMLEVAVIRGIVTVGNAKEGKPLTLTTGERAICKRDGAPQLIANVPSLEYPGWLHGKWYFDKATFADACREIEMRFDVAIRIDDANVRNEIVTGMLNARDAESALRALCGLTGKQFRHNGQTYTVH